MKRARELPVLEPRGLQPVCLPLGMKPQPGYRVPEEQW